MGMGRNKAFLNTRVLMQGEGADIGYILKPNVRQQIPERVETRSVGNRNSMKACGGGGKYRQNLTNDDS